MAGRGEHKVNAHPRKSHFICNDAAKCVLVPGARTQEPIPLSLTPAHARGEPRPLVLPPHYFVSGERIFTYGAVWCCASCHSCFGAPRQRPARAFFCCFCFLIKLLKVYSFLFFFFVLFCLSPYLLFFYSLRFHLSSFIPFLFCDSFLVSCRLSISFSSLHCLHFNLHLIQFPSSLSLSPLFFYLIPSLSYIF